MKYLGTILVAYIVLFILDIMQKPKKAMGFTLLHMPI